MDFPTSKVKTLIFICGSLFGLSYLSIIGTSMQQNLNSPDTYEDNSKNEIDDIKQPSASSLVDSSSPNEGQSSSLLFNWERSVKFLSKSSNLTSLFQPSDNHQIKANNAYQIMDTLNRHLHSFDDQRYFETDPSYYLKRLLSVTRQLEEGESIPQSHSVQIVIVTSWRSGSSFLEAIFKSHPGTFDIHEPLHSHGLVRLGPSGFKFQEAASFLHQLLKCRVTQNTFLPYMKKNGIMKFNTQYMSVCKRRRNELCYKKDFFELSCRTFPRLVTKIVRAGLDVVEPALEDPSLNTKVVLLMRDPRGTFSSRVTSIAWCNHMCKDVPFHCQSMDRDLDLYFKFRKRFPGKFHLVRYEDLAMSPLNRSRLLMKEMGLDFTPEIEQFIQSHTSMDGGLDPLSTMRVSSKRVMLWTKNLSLKNARRIQESCSSIMARLGYLPINDTLTALSIEDVLKPLDLSES